MQPSNLQEWVKRWEEREVTFRKEIQALRDHFAKRDKAYDQMLGSLGQTLSEKQQQLLRIRDIPLVGKWLIKYSEKRDYDRVG